MTPEVEDLVRRLREDESRNTLSDEAAGVIEHQAEEIAGLKEERDRIYTDENSQTWSSA